MRFLFACSLLVVTLGACGGSVDSTPTPGEDSGAPLDSSAPLADSAIVDSGGVDTGLGFETTPFDTALLDVGPDDVGPAPPPVPRDKVDLLLVVDNSLSMSDKQGNLARAIPELIKGLTSPDAASKRVPIESLHVGVITSSLGSHGTSACDPSVTNVHNDDHGHLLPRAGEGGGSGYQIDPSGATVSATCPAAVAASPISWVFDATKDPGAMFVADSGATKSQVAASCVVESAQEDGCGYEETLESTYHFLADPAPYQSALVKCTFGVSGDACGTNRIEVKGLDTALVAQRKAFLRDDSYLVVVVLSDENDSSLKPAQLNWLPFGYGAGQMQRGWKACETIPDDFEPETASEYDLLHTKFDCFSCFENTADPRGNCSVPWAKDKLNADPDGRNLRAFHQLQRYGYSFLWGRRRYVDAFTRAIAIGSDGVAAPNPIFAGGRPFGNVLFVTIVGVPNALVADVTGKPKSLDAADWEKIVSPDLGKRDPHMIESIAPRTAYGIKRYAGDRTIDPINGGDRDIPDGDDLQYACIAKRATAATGNECFGTTPEASNPLCSAGGKQPYFKAYPGLRHLRVVHDLGALGMAASICNDSLSPVMQAIVDRMQPGLKAR